MRALVVYLLFASSERIRHRSRRRARTGSNTPTRPRLVSLLKA